MFYNELLKNFAQLISVITLLSISIGLSRNVTNIKENEIRSNALLVLEHNTDGAYDTTTPYHPPAIIQFF